jgi:hypothetical protein
MIRVIEGAPSSSDFGSEAPFLDSEGVGLGDAAALGVRGAAVGS